jgi:5-aminopentanamidase
VKVAAYQAPLAATVAGDVLDLIREQVEWCEAEGVEILCCPEAVLGGLADYAGWPLDIAIDVEGGQLEVVLAPLASDSVTTIVGFTELDRRGGFYNSAAVFHKGAVAGIYRKLFPAINQSVYQAGVKTPVFSVGGLIFGIVICRDSSFREPAAAMAAQGATALFVPTNTGMPPAKGGEELVGEARDADIARAMENRVAVIRADVAGRHQSLIAHGSSAIVDANGIVLHAARRLSADVIVADIGT